MRRHLRPLLAAPLAAALTGCGDCAEAEHAVVLSFLATDTGGVQVTPSDASATYRRRADAGEGWGEELACEGLADGELGCGSLPGEYWIVADAFGFEATSIELTAGEGACGVETVQHALSLPTVDCAGAPTPGLIVWVEGPDGAEAPGASVSYTPDGGAPALCDDDIEDGWGYDSGEDDEPREWYCGWQYDGALDYRVEAPGYATWEERVEIAAGECAPLTESRSVTLSPL